MKKIIPTICLSLAVLGVASNLYAHPASTEYVNQRINETVNALVSQITELRVKPHVIGETYQGGVIFFVDDTGLHGLIAAKRDANEGLGVQWKNGETGEKVTNAKASGIGAGAVNTKLIIAEQTDDFQEGNFAALSAASYSVSADGETPCSMDYSVSQICYSDWSLPSIYELDLMHRNLGEKGGFAASSYWSSTELGVNEAWLKDMQTGVQSLSDKANALGLVRAIRLF